MAILNIKTDEIGEVGVKPRIVKIDTNNTIAEVLATGFLNDAVQRGGFFFSEEDYCLVTTKLTPSTVATQVGAYEISKVGSDWSLVSTGAPGEVTLPTVNGNIAKFTDATGTLADSAVAVSAVQLSANIIAATSADIGGAGAGPLDVTVAGLTAASVVVASIESSSNAVSLVVVNAGAGKFSVTCSANPGAALLVNYVAFVAAQ